METASDRSFFGHPRGLATLFFTEMWERWSFYGMRSILTPFLAGEVLRGGLAFPEGQAKSLYHIYLALIYLMSVPGGWIADRFLGQRRSVLCGGILIMAGHVVLAIHGVTTFFAGLLLVVFGTGMLKPNVSAVVGGLYSRDDARRDAAFSIFYMGINLGSFLGQMAAPFLAQHSSVRAFLSDHGLDPNYCWRLGFGSAAVGMLFGVIQYVRGQKRLGQAGGRPSAPASRSDWLTLWVGIVGALVVVGTVLVLTRQGHLTVAEVDDSFGIGLVLLTVLAFARIFTSGTWTRGERNRLIAILVLFVASCFFWAAFEQAGSTLNLFAVNETDTHLLGIEFPAGWYQNVNSICTILLSPVFAWIWLALAKRNPSHPTKFALGLIFAGLGYVVMERGAASVNALGEGARVTGLFLITTYFFHSVGEVCLSPVGLSAMTRLAPARVTSLMMGIWFLSISVGSYMGGRIAHIYEGLSEQGLYRAIAGLTIGVGVLMLLLVRPLNRLSESPD